MLFLLKVNVSVTLIFHRGAKVLAQPKEGLIQDESGLLTWKTNDRAVATFKDMAEILATQQTLTELVNEWVHVRK